jgi:hypothetical protein
MSFPLQNAEPSVAFKRGQFDFRQVFEGLSSSRMVRLDGRGALLSHPLSAGKEEGLRICFPAAAFVTITCALPVKHDI